ncbi:MAG: DUF494 family protein [Candidatus Eiseniibacteriota bacterium]
MNEHVKATLKRIVHQLRAALEGDEFALEDLQEALLSSGATAEDLQTALEAILTLTEPNREDLPETESGSARGNRVLSLEESCRLTPEAYGYLLNVRGSGTIDEEQFEWVLERALASGERRVGLPEIQDLVLEAALGGFDGPGGDRGEFPGVH